MIPLLKYDIFFLEAQNVKISKLNKAMLINIGLPVFFNPLGESYCYPSLKISNKIWDKDRYYFLAYTSWSGDTNDHLAIKENSDAVFICRLHIDKFKKAPTFINSNLESFIFFFTSLNMFYLKYNTMIRKGEKIFADNIKEDFDKLKKELLSQDRKGLQTIYWSETMSFILLEDFGDYFTGHAYEEDKFSKFLAKDDLDSNDLNF